MEDACKWFGSFWGIPYCEMEPWKRTMAETLCVSMQWTTTALLYANPIVLACLALRGQWGVADCALVAWCFSEVLFYIYSQARLHHTQKTIHQVPQLNSCQRMELANRMVDQIVDMRKVLGGWLIPPKEDIVAGDLLKWIVWAFFGKEPYLLNPCEREEATVLMQIVHREIRDPQKMALNWNGGRPCMRPTMDAMDVRIMPLIAYVWIAMFKVLTAAVWSLAGFEWHELIPGMSYWILTPDGEEDGPPILFFHGTGPGLCMYLVHVLDLKRQYPRRKFLLPSIGFTSASPAAPYLSRPEIVRGIDRLLEVTNTPRVSILAQSYGTLIAGWYTSHNPARIARMTLLDPVCFEMWNANFAFNAIYSQPSCFSHNLFYILSSDAFFIELLHRVWPYDYFVVAEAFSAPTTVFIATREWASTGAEAYAYLLSRKAKSNLAQLNVHLLDMSHGESGFNRDLYRSFTAEL